MPKSTPFSRLRDLWCLQMDWKSNSLMTMMFFLPFKGSQTQSAPGEGGGQSTTDLKLCIASISREVTKGFSWADHKKGITCKGELGAAELGANTDAKHTCTKKKWNIFSQIFFFLMLTKEFTLVLENFQILHKLKKKDDLTFSSHLHMLDQCQHLLSQTKWS